MTLEQACFRATIQLLVASPTNIDDVRLFGSGFFLHYKGHQFLITADHVVHPDDHDPYNDSAQRTKNDYQLMIVTNIVDQATMSSVMLPAGGFYYFTGYDFGNKISDDKARFKHNLDSILDNTASLDDETLEIGICIPDMIDIAIACVDKKICTPILTNLVVDADNNIIVNQGTSKIMLEEQGITEIKETDLFYLAGTVKNKFVNTIRLDRINAFYTMTYNKTEPDRTVKLNIGDSHNIEDWAGLSGGPVLNQDGKLAGIAIRVSVADSVLTMMPMSRICWFLDKILAIR